MLVKRTWQERAAALAADPSIRPHGNVSTYTNWGCRCDACCEAKAAYHRWWEGLGGRRRKERRRSQPPTEGR